MLLGVWTWFLCRIGGRSPVDYSDPAQSPEYDLRMIARSRHIRSIVELSSIYSWSRWNGHELTTLIQLIHLRSVSIISRSRT